MSSPDFKIDLEKVTWSPEPASEVRLLDYYDRVPKIPEGYKYAGFYPPGKDELYLNPVEDTQVKTAEWKFSTPRVILEKIPEPPAELYYGLYSPQAAHQHGSVYWRGTDGKEYEVTQVTLFGRNHGSVWPDNQQIPVFLTKYLHGGKVGSHGWLLNTRKIF